MFLHRISYAIESGLLEKWEMVYFKKKPQEKDQDYNNSYQKLNLIQLGNAFFIYGIICCISFICFCSEHFTQLLPSLL